ncbi:uncharacterized protein KGF55_005238 [Candida pseudojiufengensis]|uniref:uncharacterized protein n=1 Tax=Candida pseudojiufengensis TaxID=497109 RepID=UPI002225681B|nr:uncharacterized protein KGF55_005238 [Candida pseudojiufengensis]KAI5959594.1 hypothetical protein KGF55_005238 [Candida pseudojiufengensis]
MSTDVPKQSIKNVMQSLLLDRKLGLISPLKFSSLITENYYSSLIHQTAKYNVFPSNCHHIASVNSLSLETNDFRFLLSGSGDSTIKLWDLSENEVIREENEIDKNLNQVQNPNKFDNFDYDNPVSVYANIATIPRREFHKFGISALQWWPFDTGMFVSSSFDHTVKIWDTNELSPVHTFDLNNRVYSIDICGNNSLIATASDQPFIRILDMKSTSSAHTLTGHKGKTLSVKWHPTNSNLLVSGGYDGEVRIWDIRRSKSLLCRLDMLRTNTSQSNSEGVHENLTQNSVKAHSGPVNGLVWDESGTILYTSGNDDKVRVWDMASTSYPPVNKLINFGPLTRNKYPQTIPILLNPKGETSVQYLLFPSESGEILIFRTIDGKLVNRLSRRGTKNVGRTTSMCNGGPFTAKYFAGTNDGEIIQWSPFWEHPDLEDLRIESRNENDSEDIDELLLKKHTLALKAQELMKDAANF